MAAMLFRLQCFEGETKWLPLSRQYIIKLIFPYGIVFLFFQIWLQCVSKFLNRNLCYYLIILHWEGIKRRAQDDVITWKRFSLILVQCVDHRSPWVPCTKGRCRRGSSTQEQRYPPPLPPGATATPTCGTGLTVATQDQEYPLRKLREMRGTYFISYHFYVMHYMNT